MVLTNPPAIFPPEFRVWKHASSGPHESAFLERGTLNLSGAHKSVLLGCQVCTLGCLDLWCVAVVVQAACDESGIVLQGVGDHKLEL